MEGVPDDDSAEWFTGMAPTTLPGGSGETVISGNVVDQAALYGLLNKIHDLGLRLIALESGR